MLDELHVGLVPAQITLDHLFIFRDDKGRWRPLDEKTINAELTLQKKTRANARSKKARNQAVEAKPKLLSEMLGEPVDLDRISRSAATLLVEYGGMNELTAALVRGLIPRHLASQAFYTNMTHEEVGQAHRQAANKLFEHMTSVSREWTMRLGIFPLVANSAHQETGILLSPAGANVGRIGSPFVPQAKPLREYLTRLRVGIDDCADWRLSFNRLTAYSTLVLMLLTAAHQTRDAQRLCARRQPRTG